jgi:hypothetical protein
LFAGRKQIRDRSADSTRSGGSASGRRVTFPATTEEKTPSPVAVKAEAPAPSNTSAVDSLRNMGNSLNPLNRFASINVLPRFGRAVSSSSTPTLPTPVAETAKQSPSPEPLSSTSKALLRRQGCAGTEVEGGGGAVEGISAAGCCDAGDDQSLSAWDLHCTPCSSGCICTVYRRGPGVLMPTNGEAR